MPDATIPSPVERLRSLLAALIRAALMSDEDGQPWLREAQSHRDALVSGRAPLAIVSLDAPWILAIGDAEGPASREQERRASTSLPKACPLRLAEITGAEFDAAALAATIRSSAATG